MSVAERYTSELRQQFQCLAAWLPTVSLNLGSIGELGRDRVFSYVDDIGTLGIEFETDVGNAKGEFSHSSASGVEYDVKAKGEASALAPHLPQASAGIGFKFHESGATFFQLGNVQHERIKNQLSVKEAMLTLAKEGKWDKNWLVVTEVYRANRAVVLVSEASGATAELAVDADVGLGGLKALTAGGGVSLHHSDSLATKITAEEGLTPLFRAVRIKRKFFIGARTVAPAWSHDVESALNVDDDSVSADDLVEDVTAYDGPED